MIKHILSSLVIALMFAAAVPTSPSLAQANNPEALSDPRKEALALEIMKEIRCLQCQNQSIEDSNADLAKDLRKLIRIKVDEGMTRAQVKAYLVERYGDWVLLKPPVKSTTYLLWVSPFFLLFIGVYAAVRKKRMDDQMPASAQEAGVQAPLNRDEQAALDQLLADTQEKLAAEDDTDQKDVSL